MDRTERQKLCMKRWLQANGKGSVVACTGFGFYKYFCTRFGIFKIYYYICKIKINKTLWNEIINFEKKLVINI